MDRLLTQLIYPIISIHRKSWYLYLSSWTEKPLEPSFNPDSLALLLSKDLTYDSYIKNNRIRNFNALVPIQQLPLLSFARWSIWVNLYQKTIYNNLEISQTSEIDKEDWNYFWNLFNIFQSENFLTAEIINEQEKNNAITSLFDEIKEYYPEYLWNVIEKGIYKSWITNKNAEYLDSWTDKDGNVLADAELVLELPRIVIAPSSLESYNIFKENEYIIYDIDHINEIEI